MQVKAKSVLIIVAHPDDETLWAGGTILSHPEWSVFVISLCRASDTDRAPKFNRAKVNHHKMQPKFFQLFFHHHFTTKAHHVFDIEYHQLKIRMRIKKQLS